MLTCGSNGGSIDLEMLSFSRPAVALLLYSFASALDLNSGEVRFLHAGRDLEVLLLPFDPIARQQRQTQCIRIARINFDRRESAIVDAR